MKSFDVLSPTLDVTCSRLIEASAGTGKTFALEHLTLRWLLSSKEALLDQVALITFTRKSAQDLRERLRQRFEKAHQELRENRFESPYLASVEEEKKPLLLLKLIESLMNFDLMPISTIHAFAAKLLNRGGWFLEDPSGLQKEYLHQLIALHLESLHVETKKKLSKEDTIVLRLLEQLNWDNEALTKELAKALSCGLEIGAKNEGCVNVWKEHFESDANLPSYEDLLELAKEFKESFRKDGQIYYGIKRNLENWKSCLEQNEILDSDRLIELLEHFSASNIKKKSSEAAKALTVWVENKARALEELSSLSLKKRGLEILAHRLKKALAPLFKRDLRLGHDVILKKLEEALDSPLGSFLANSLKLLIVDEFQDTDPTQWRLFQKLTQLNPSLQLILVGDPKQSIYGFRQADIYTYLKAKEYVQEHLKGSIDQLSTNYRSHPKLVLALNHLMASKQAGPWLQLPRAKSHLDCPAVLAGRNEPLEDLEPRLVFHDLDSHEGQETLQAAAYWIACEFHRLQAKGNHTFAILVSEHKVSRKLQKFLEEKGLKIRIQRPLPFAQLPSFELFRLILEAFEKPYLGDRMRRLWSHPFWNLSYEEIEGLLGLKKQEILESQDLWSPFWQRLTVLHYQLLEKGVGAFLQHFWDLKLPTQETSLGKRVKSKAQIHQVYEQMQALWMWLEEQKPHVYAHEALRLLKALESGENEETALYYPPQLEGAIDILTVHASKGLEYQVVFCLSDLAKKAGPAPKWMQVYDQNEPRIVSSGASHPSYLEACDELDAEKARRLYVAWTRAREYLLIGYQSQGRSSSKTQSKTQSKTEPKDQSKSQPKAQVRRSQATGFELFRASWQSLPQPSIANWYEVLNQTPCLFEKELNELCQKNIVAMSSYENLELHSHVRPLNEVARSRSQPIEAECVKRVLWQNYWRRSSFSGLLRSSDAMALSLFTEVETSNQDLEGAGEEDSMGLVPRGTEVGVFWHLMFQRSLQLLQQGQTLEFIRQYLTDEPWYKEGGALLEQASITAMASQVVKLLDMTWVVELAGQTISFCLAKLAPGSVWTEKKFEMSRHKVRELFQDKIQFGVDPIQLSGVIDAIIALPQGLIFIDWKSNWLGPNQSYYQAEAVKQSALDHRYDLQALIYQGAIQTSLLPLKKGPFLGGLYFYIRGLAPLLWNPQSCGFEKLAKGESVL